MLTTDTHQAADQVVCHRDSRATTLDDVPLAISARDPLHRPFAPFPAQRHLVLRGALSDRPPTVQRPLPLAQPFRRFADTPFAGTSGDSTVYA